MNGAFRPKAETEFADFATTRLGDCSPAVCFRMRLPIMSCWIFGHGAVGICTAKGKLLCINPSGVLADTTSLYTREALVPSNAGDTVENRSSMPRTIIHRPQAPPALRASPFQGEQILRLSYFFFILSSFFFPPASPNRGPAEAQRKRVRWGKEEQGSERSFSPQRRKRSSRTLRRRGRLWCGGTPAGTVQNCNLS